jgi:hypothetical protein
MIKMSIDNFVNTLNAIGCIVAIFAGLLMFGSVGFFCIFYMSEISKALSLGNYRRSAEISLSLRFRDSPGS